MIDQHEPDAAEPFQLYLGSASPRRRELLAQLGLRYRAVVPHIDETPRPDECAKDLVARLARDKAQAALALVQARGWPRRPVLGADTEVVVDGEVLGKPGDLAHAHEILGRLSGRSHEVLTALAVTGLGVVDTAVSCSEVTFKTLSRAEIDAYWATGEPCDKAGAYAVQGRGAIFVRRLVGSYSGVMGLPLYELNELLLRAGIKCL